SLAHSDDPAGTNLDASFLQVADRFDAILVGVTGAMIGEETAGAFQIMPVALQAGFFEAVGDFLAFNDSERGIGTGFSARRQLLDPLANFIKHRSFGQTLPSRNQAHG